MTQIATPSVLLNYFHFPTFFLGGGGGGEEGFFSSGHDTGFLTAFCLRYVGVDIRRHMRVTNYNLHLILRDHILGKPHTITLTSSTNQVNMQSVPVG
jgi:hypothetical protein